MGIKFRGKIKDPKDLITKEYADEHYSGTIVGYYNKTDDKFYKNYDGTTYTNEIEPTLGYLYVDITDETDPQAFVCYAKDEPIPPAPYDDFFIKVNLPKSGYINVCYGNGKYVSINKSTADSVYSSDGINWTEESNGLSSIYWRDIAYGKEKYVAVGAENNKIAYSSDGINWTEIDGPHPVGVTLTSCGDSIIFDGNKFISVGIIDWYIESEDGVNWILKDYPDEIKAISGWEATKIQFINGKYFQLNKHNNSAYLYSEDGNNWQVITTLSTTDSSPSIIAYGKGKYILFDDNENQIFTSTDGINWIKNTGEGIIASKLAVFANNMFLSIAKMEYSFNYSVDGENWIKKSVKPEDFTNGFEYLIYAKEKYIAMGEEHASYMAWASFTTPPPVPPTPITISWNEKSDAFSNTYYRTGIYDGSKYIASSIN